MFANLGIYSSVLNKWADVDIVMHGGVKATEMITAAHVFSSEVLACLSLFKTRNLTIL